MTHQEKIDHLVLDLGKRGIGPYSAAPFLFRVLWGSGINVPPPLFLGILPNMLLLAVYFYVALEVSLWLLLWLFGAQLVQVGIWKLILAPAGGALLIGLIEAGLCRWKAAQLGLPSWAEYPKNANT